MVLLGACNRSGRLGPLHGTDLEGRTVTWAPQPGTLSIVLVVSAKGCAGCVSGVLDAVTLLASRRPREVRTAVVVTDGVSRTVAGLCPPGATLMLASRESLARSLLVSGLPVLLVGTRGGTLARIERIPPIATVPENLADELERYFALEE